MEHDYKSMDNICDIKQTYIGTLRYEIIYSNLEWFVSTENELGLKKVKDSSWAPPVLSTVTELREKDLGKLNLPAAHFELLRAWQPQKWAHVLKDHTHARSYCFIMFHIVSYIVARSRVAHSAL